MTERIKDAADNSVSVDTWKNIHAQGKEFGARMTRRILFDTIVKDSDDFEIDGLIRALQRIQQQRALIANFLKSDYDQAVGDVDENKGIIHKIKAVRKATGLGLKESKMIVDHFEG